MEKCIIVGAGTYGQVYAEYLKEKYHIVGFIDDNPDLISTRITGLPVLGNLDHLLHNISKDILVFVPIGNPQTKIRILNIVRLKGFETPNYIHNSVNLDPSVKLGNQGIYILQGTIIMPLVEIENDVMISSGSIISHHTKIEGGTFISFGVKVGASLTIKENAYLGIGCLVMTGITEIGKNSTIGAGAVIIKDVPDNAVMVGNPGRLLRMKEL